MVKKVVLIAAVQEDGGIGKNNSLGWNIPEELKHFKDTTMGHAVIVGRKTWESLPARRLKGRMLFVITSNKDLLENDLKHTVGDFAESEGVVFVANYNRALEVAEMWSESVGKKTIFIAGGSQLYKHAMTRVDELLISMIEGNPIKDPDTFLPTINLGIWDYENADVKEVRNDKGELLFEILHIRKLDR